MALGVLAVQAGGVPARSAAATQTATAPGTQLWEARYDGPARGAETIAPGVVQSMAVSRDGSTVFVTGASAGATTGNDYATVAYDATSGEQRWVARYDGPAQGEDVAGAVAVSPGGDTVLVTGGSTGANGSLDIATVAYDAATGGQQWVARYDGRAGNNEGAGSIAVDPSGTKVFVSGTSEGAAPDGGGDLPEKTYATIAYDTATGKQLWAERLDGPANRDSAASLAVSPKGGAVFVTGWSQLERSRPGRPTQKDFATVAYDASTGTKRWVARYHAPRGSGDDEGRSVVVSPDGKRVFVTGMSQGPWGLGYTTVAYDASTGTKRWAHRRTSPPRTGDTYASPMAVSPDGATVIVTGINATVAYKAASGATRWVRPDAASVAVSRDGSTVLVTGAGAGATTGNDYATVAYRTASGKQRWGARYDGPAHGDDTANSVVASPKGRTVFVHGISEGVGSGPDYATVAYRG